jgi:peptidoglycan/LPS O-acetylase OafA/YrhL
VIFPKKKPSVEGWIQASRPGCVMLRLEPMLILDPSKNDTSVTLDLLRAVAAQAVCVGHAISFFKSDIRPAWMPLMQNVGVLIFFLLSGLVIASTLWRRSANPDYGFRQFFIDRFARIYSGLVPALIFVAVVDAATMSLGADKSLYPYNTPKTFICNLFMLEGYFGIFQSALRTSAFGSAAPLWTLAIEWHIYMFVGGLFFIAVRRRNLFVTSVVVLFSSQVALHYLAGSFQDERDVGKSLFSLWLVGFAIYFLTPRIGALKGLFCFAASAVCYLIVTTPYYEYSLLSYVPLAFGFAAIVWSTQTTNTLYRFYRPIGFFAGYSFTLYLTHHTLMTSIHALHLLSGWTALLVSIVASNLVAISIAWCGERHHKSIARLLNAKRRNSAVLPSAS